MTIGLTLMLLVAQLQASATAPLQSQGDTFALQRACAESAHLFLGRRGWQVDDFSNYENHFNSRSGKCFVLVSVYLPNEDFRTIDLYDAVEGRRYGTYNGHDICDASITGNPRKCAVDGGSIWFDGSDSRRPADFTVGFRGLAYGGGSGDETTQRLFLERARVFMTQ